MQRERERERERESDTKRERERESEGEKVLQVREVIHFNVQTFISLVDAFLIGSKGHPGFWIGFLSIVTIFTKFSFFLPLFPPPFFFSLSLFPPITVAVVLFSTPFSPPWTDRFILMGLIKLSPACRGPDHTGVDVRLDRYYKSSSFSSPPFFDQ